MDDRYSASLLRFARQCVCDLLCHIPGEARLNSDSAQGASFWISDGSTYTTSSRQRTRRLFLDLRWKHLRYLRRRYTQLPARWTTVTQPCCFGSRVNVSVTCVIPLARCTTVTQPCCFGSCVNVSVTCVIPLAKPGLTATAHTAPLSGSPMEAPTPPPAGSAHGASSWTSDGSTYATSDGGTHSYQLDGRPLLSLAASVRASMCL